MTNGFPFMFDAEKINEFFKAPEFAKFFDAAKLPNIDVDSALAAQKKNVDAIVEANKVAVAGYQELYKRQVEIFEAAMAVAKDQVAEFQGQPLTAEQASKNVELMKTAFDKALAEITELSEMAQKANTEAFEVVKGRFEEAVAEFQAAAEKLVH